MISSPFERMASRSSCLALTPTMHPILHCNNHLTIYTPLTYSRKLERSTYLCLTNKNFLPGLALPQLSGRDYKGAEPCTARLETPLNHVNALMLIRYKNFLTLCMNYAAIVGSHSKSLP